MALKNQLYVIVDNRGGVVNITDMVPVVLPNARVNKSVETLLGSGLLHKIDE